MGLAESEIGTPEAQELANERSEAALTFAKRVLGKAVHPAAIERLFDVWPEAQVEVWHDWVWRTDPFTQERRQTRRTVVEIWEGERNPVNPSHTRRVQREALVHPDDNFERKTGIRVAFDRCLREAVRRSDPGRVSGVGRSL